MFSQSTGVVISMNQINKNFTSIEQAASRYLPNNKQTASSILPSGKSFREILLEQQSITGDTELKFSKHANERLLSRKIDLTSSQLERLQSGARRAGEKGIKESLVMVDNLAFIVNIKNNTVVTAVNDGEDRVFTNIDGAVIM